VKYIEELNIVPMFEFELLFSAFKRNTEVNG
jgi:hypothetical protein